MSFHVKRLKKNPKIIFRCKRELFVFLLHELHGWVGEGVFWFMKLIEENKKKE